MRIRHTIVALVAAYLYVGSGRAAEPPKCDPELLKTFRAEFVLITPGKGEFPLSFRRGGKADGVKQELPVHEVTLKRPFSVAKYEVPQNLWEGVMGTNPSRWKGKRNSVEMISQPEAVEFCRKVTDLLREAKLIEATAAVRLPSEAEWEYFTRAGTSTAYSFGDDAKALDEFAWHTGNAAGNDPPVGAKKPNAWGLHDTHGYLWEWCADAWHDDYTGAPADGSAWTTADAKERFVVRGGSWKDKAERLTSSYRVGLPAATRDDAVGVRCVLK